MTSGQGGPPPGWGPEQGSPSPYGPPPGQWPAYAPPPPLPQPVYNGPAPTERPLSVRAGLGGFIGSIVLSAISAVVTFLNWNVLLADSLAKLRAQGQVSAETLKSAADFGLQVGIGAAVLSVALYGLFVWFAWRGRNWARIVLWVLGGLGLIGGLISLAAPTSPVPFLSGLNAFRTLLVLVGVVALALKPSNEWFRYQGWLRATGQR
jgi:hypothetical protein